MASDFVLLGIDGGGTHCRARLVARCGAISGEAVTGAANLLRLARAAAQPRTQVT